MTSYSPPREDVVGAFLWQRAVEFCQLASRSGGSGKKPEKIRPGRHASFQAFWVQSSSSSSNTPNNQSQPITIKRETENSNKERDSEREKEEES